MTMLTRNEVIAVLGPVGDDLIVEIVGTGASQAELAEAYTWLRSDEALVNEAARELFNKSENERSGVLSTAMSFLGLYRDPVVAKVTSRCDWRITDLSEWDGPATLYLVAPPSDISRTK